MYRKLQMCSKDFEFLFPVEISGLVELSTDTNVQMSGRNTKIHHSTTIPKLVRYGVQMGSGSSRPKKPVLQPILTRRNSRLDFRLEPYFRIYRRPKFGIFSFVGSDGTKIGQNGLL